MRGFPSSCEPSQLSALNAVLADLCGQEVGAIFISPSTKVRGSFLNC